MTVHWLLASLHLLGLGVGLGAVFARGWAFRGPFDDARFDRVFLADNLWALAALLWLGTGLLRAFGGYEKGTAYYLAAPLFHLKLSLFVLVLLLELWPMVTLVRWRVRRRRGQGVDTSRAPAFARISFLQGGIVVTIVFVATALARGW